MHRTVSLSLAIAIALCLASTAMATPTVIVGPGGVNVPYIVPAGQTAYPIQIIVTGGDPVPGVDLFAEIEGGGPGLYFSAIDIVNGTFLGANRLNTAFQVGPGVPNKVIGYGNVVIGPPGFPSTMPANGVMGTLFLNTVGVDPGFYTLKLADVTGLGNSDFGADEFDVITADITNGLVQIVPEPAGMLLGMFALAGLAFAGLRKHRARRAA